MRVVQDGLWLYKDCTYVACNGSHGMDLPAHERARLEMAVNRIPHLVPSFNSETGEGLLEFSGIRCETCGTTAASYRAEFVQLGEGNDPTEVSQ